jgi:hypothetical protein
VRVTVSQKTEKNRVKKSTRLPKSPQRLPDKKPAVPLIEEPAEPESLAVKLDYSARKKGRGGWMLL